jgi:hypothetical protein
MLVSIKVLFGFMVLSSAALIGVAIAVFVRVRWQLKSRRARSRNSAEAADKSGQESLP